MRLKLPLAIVGLVSTGTLLSIGCGPRHPANTAGTGTAVAAATSTPATTATATTTTPATTAPTPTPTPTTPSTPPPVGTWGTTPPPTMDPAVLNDLLQKAAGAMGVQLPSTGTPTPGAPAADPLEATLRANAAKYAPGFQPATPVGRAKGLKTGEHAGMNVDMTQGKCYVVLAAGAPTVTQLGLHLLFPAAPPNVPMASDTAHGNQPVLGDGKPLCPPSNASVRVDTVPMAGTGDVAVQVFVK